MRAPHAGPPVFHETRRAGRLTSLLLAVVGTIALGLTLTTASAATAQPLELIVRPLEPTPVAGPPLPGSDDFSARLVLDDGTAEAAFGIGGATARQFLWFQVFDAPVPNFTLEEIWVLFPDDPVLVPGAPIQLAVFTDLDLDPSAGTMLLATYDEVVQAADGATFSVYTLPEPIEITGGRKTLLGVVNRYVVEGVTPSTQPAALDTDAPDGRSWVAVWSGPPPDPPILPPDQSLFPIDDLVEGDWMIRGFGTATSVVEIPTLGAAGLGALVALLGLAGVGIVRRRV